MEYTIRKKTLPTFFKSVSGAAIHVSSKEFRLGSSRIEALHYHDMAELGICLFGEGETHIENRVYNYHDGCVQYVPPRVSHLSTSKENTTSSWVWISFSPTALLRKAGLIDPDAALSLASEGDAISGVFEADEYPNLSQAIQEVWKEYEDKKPFFELAVALAVCRFYVVAARLKRSVGDGGGQTLKSSPVQPAIEFISYNLDDKEALGEENLARLCKMSVATLRRAFHEYTGIAPKTFVLQSRMANAEHLLRQTDLSVTEIAMRSGYSDVSGFNRIFRKYFGASPSVYRKSRRG